ncbi:hypothetical protein GPECTOR_56g405 [Gonium pectorale]|uniref:Uncharacterized protein n=1 Tax=Gonium pectorale TaxID=33097 RepID=A0A150G659_GONPE|nr:hypothetical protein GPECTOR_56g405 [Gonium pectorale]|eukprot:KXZ45308.1 hypothetical protein GPECTOR_56g405 [Gonium pectorale]
MLRTPEFTTVRLSEPVPYHAFAWRWGRPGAMRELTRAQRRELMCLTAASGATDNLALAAQSVGCPLTAEVCYTAGKAGQLGSCALLAQLGCDMRRAVEGAAAGGRQALCEELSSWAGIPCNYVFCAVAAAEAGHTHIVEWMVRRRDEVMRLRYACVDAWVLMRAVAEGCDLAALQRYFVELGRQEAGEEGVEDWLKEAIHVVAAAAGSPTPDWRAKVEWLESRGFPRTPGAYTAAAKRPDALKRFGWLAQRGYPSRPEDGYGDEDAPLVVAASAGNAAALLFLAEGRPSGKDFTCMWCAAAAKGHLHVLQALHAAGRCDDGFPLIVASAERDAATLECLRRLGCPRGA